MTIEDMKEIKHRRGYTDEKIAQLSGVPLEMVRKIFCGEMQAIECHMQQALEAVLGHERTRYGFDMSSDKTEHQMVREEAVYQATQRQGDYTIEDYYALPDDRRVELIDGVIYDMGSPTFVHQGVAGEIYFQIADFVRKNKGNCFVRISPVDVRLDCDNKTMVQPDVLIVCDQSKIMRWGIMGAPDFVLEVLSPSTRRKDCFKKLVKYMEAGVKEYWLIDPDAGKLIVYWFEEEIYPEIYGLQGKVPVGIYGGELEIDLDLVAEQIRDYPDGGRDD